MPNCPSCNAQLDDETLVPDSTSVCPSCGSLIEIDGDDINLSSLAGGSPADATMRVAPGSDSSLSGSSLAPLDDASSELDSSDPSSETTLDSGFASDSDSASDLPVVEATMAIGGDNWFGDDDDDEEGGGLLDTDFEVDDLDEKNQPTYESLDATIDLCNWMPPSGADDFDLSDPDNDPEDGGPEEEGPTIALGEADVPIGLGGAPGARDITMMVGESDQPSESSDPPDATLAADSDRAGSSGTGLSGSDSSLTDSSMERTESPSSMPNDATLAFDSERRSGGVDTPEPLDITGLDSGDTIPRGPLDDGRASKSLKPGESLVVGDESVRLRVSTIADPGLIPDGSVDFAIEGEAGKGGMGVVYKARQQSLDRLVAVKQIKSEMGASDSDRNKFVSEAVITGQLEHPNIAPVHDLGLAEDGLPFYAMKFVEGEDWEDSIKGLSEEENLGILIQVAQAIAFSHSKQVLHRDLKPGNVRLGSFGEVLVMDWGLAARLGDGSEIQPAGTPIYMPPETALEYLDYAKGKVVGGKRVGSSRRRIPAGEYGDIYLLGALLFKIVTGRAPHRGKTTFECLRNAAKNEIAKTRRNSELLSIAYKAMATEPEARHATATEFVDDLKAYQSHAQSILIAKQASKDLREAGRLVEGGKPDTTQLYALYSSAQNGYQNALDLWDGNRKAKRRLARTQRMFATTAYENGDFDLALSLLVEDSQEDAELRNSIAKAQSSRNARLAWFKTLQYATAASLMVALGFIGYSVILKQDALSLRTELSQTETKIQEKEELASRKEREAEAATRLAEQKSEEAAQAEKLAAVQEAAAKENGIKAELALAKAEAAEQDAAQSERLAREKSAEAKQAVAIASEKTAEAERQSYLAVLGRLKAVLTENGAYAAWRELQAIDRAVYQAHLNDPEWRATVAQLDWQDEATELLAESQKAGSQPTHVATSANGEWTAIVASAAGFSELLVYRTSQAEPVYRGVCPTPPGPSAIDSSGRYVAIAGDDLTVIDTRIDRSIAMPTGTQAGCVAFHPETPELLLGASDTGVQRWSLGPDGAVLIDADDTWHQAPVTSVGYSSDGAQRFSADGSGRLIVWRLEGKEWSNRSAVQHSGAGSPEITAVAMASDPMGRLAYGCVDGAVYEVAGWWNSNTGSEGYAETISERLTTSHANEVTSVAYAEGETRLLSSGGDSILIRDAQLISQEKDRLGKTIKRERRYHAAEVLAAAPVGAGFAVSSDERGRVVRWKIDVAPDADTVASAQGRGAGVAAVSLGPTAEGERLVVADQAGFIRVWDDLRRPDLAESLFLGHADHRGFRAWRLPGLESRIVTVAADNRACVWRESDGVLEDTIELGPRTIVAVDPQTATLYASTDGREISHGPSAIAVSLREGQTQPLWTNSPRVASLTPLPSTAGGEEQLAVGLRDGQVYLWGPAGRRELIRSSWRPHRRPITALAYDTVSGSLYSGDRAGLVVGWDLKRQAKVAEYQLKPNGRTSAPIVRIQRWDGDRLLVVRETDAGRTGVALTPDLHSGFSGAVPRDRLSDLAIDSNGTLFGIRGNQFVTLDDSGRWRALAGTDGDRLGRVAATPEGWLAWGQGVVQWRPRVADRWALKTRIASRAPATTLLADKAGGVRSLTGGGSIDAWEPDGSGPTQSPLGIRGEITATHADDGKLLVAIAEENRTTRLELWDTNARERLGVIAAGRPGRCVALAGDADTFAAAYSDRLELSPRQGGNATRVALPAESGAPRSIAVSATSLAVATANGSAYLGQKSEADDWRLERLDRDDVASVAFTPGGDRLLLGVTSGRVVLSKPARASDGSMTARSLLTLGGHSDPVTLLRVAESQAGTRLISGDAAGRVVVREL